MDFGLSFLPLPTEDRVKCVSWRGGVILSLRKAYISGLSLLLCLELLKKFVVVGGGWVVVETYFSVQLKPRPS